jgi:hypothetical protein
MLKTVKFRLLFAFGVLAYLFISINVLLVKPVDSSSVITENLHLRRVSWNRPSRGSLNYDLYVIENNEHYKIGADCADCFYYSDFINKIGVGDPIKLGIRKDNGFFAKDLKLIVSIDAKDSNYLDTTCVNKEAADEKAYLPFFGALGLIVIYGLLYYQELKDAKTKGKVVKNVSDK